MNTVAKQLIKTYNKLKQQEWNNPGHNPPAGLDFLGQLTDDVFILYHLRRYLRLKMYPALFTNVKGEWGKKHYSILWDLIDSQRQRIYQNPLLYAYVWLFETIKQPAKSSDNVSEVADLLQFLRTNQDDLPTEDWVDILSAISSYSTTAENDGLVQFIPLAFTARILLADAKFGRGWRRKHIYLPYATFFNIIKQGLQVKSHFNWSTLEIDFIPLTRTTRTAQEWLRLFSKKYNSRLDPAIRETMINLMEAMICFDEQQLLRADETLQKAAWTENEIININIRILKLQLLYDLATVPAFKNGQHLRRLLAEAPAETKKLTAALAYLDQEKEKYPPVRVAAFRAWLKGYNALFGAFNVIELKGNAPNPVIRARVVDQKRKKLPPEYFTLKHQRKDWLEAAFKMLIDPETARQTL